MAGKIASLIGRAVLPRRRSFVRDERGVTAIEFGILALPFFSILGAIFETSMVFLSGQILESAVQDASRAIRTGQAQAASMNLNDFRSQVCNRLYGLFSDCSGLHVEVQVLGKFNAASISPPVDWTCKTNCGWSRPDSFTPGLTSSIMLVQVYYKWPTVMPTIGMSLADLPEGKRLLGAAAVFKNEPF
ncbi:TadE/TadG family type IV pilus assembly protein [Devosia sp. 2618]|uniref:TadE/TadG family type IV pilus assembly protein n=1 Tax=Devosia sp. 2618 TaxID=3156454 RepID=UPI0033915B80